VAVSGQITQNRPNYLVAGLQVVPLSLEAWITMPTADLPPTQSVSPQSYPTFVYGLGPRGNIPHLAAHKRTELHARLAEAWAT
jgi:hypothetical protein